MQSIQDPPLVSCFCKQPSFQCGIKQRFADIEPRRVYRNCYRVFYRVPPTGPMTSEPAKLLLFYTGTNTATNGIMSLPGDWEGHKPPKLQSRGNHFGSCCHRLPFFSLEHRALRLSQHRVGCADTSRPIPTIGLAQTFRSAIPYHASNKRRPKGPRQPDCIGSTHCNVDLESVY